MYAVRQLALFHLNESELLEREACRLIAWILPLLLDVLVVQRHTPHISRTRGFQDGDIIVNAHTQWIGPANGAAGRLNGAYWIDEANAN